MRVGYAVRLASALAGFSVAAACMAQAVPKGEVETQTEPQAVRTPQAARTHMTAPASSPMDFDQVPQTGAYSTLFKNYEAALQQQIRARWSSPSLSQGASCRLYIRQLPGGTVLMTEVRPPCAFDDNAKRSLEAAVLKAQPMAYRGFEAVFAREILMTVQAGER